MALKQQFIRVAVAAVILSACNTIVLKKPYDLYELRPFYNDNDAYYVPPKAGNGCGSINMSPACIGY